MDGQIISDCQRILAEHLPPDGPDAKTTISRLLEILDGPRSRAVEPTGPAVTVGRVEDWRVFAALANGERMPVFGIFKSTEPGKMTETHDLTEATHIVVAGGIVSLDSGAQVVVEAVY